MAGSVGWFVIVDIEVYWAKENRTSVAGIMKPLRLTKAGLSD